ncbi:MAG: hypothetical protein ABI131_11660, partial [Nostocoides sp.]
RSGGRDWMTRSGARRDRRQEDAVSDTTDGWRAPEGDPLLDPSASDWTVPIASGEDPAVAPDAPGPNPYGTPPASPYAVPQPNPYAAPQPNPYAAPQPNPYAVPQPNPYAVSPDPASPYADGNPYATPPGGYPQPGGYPAPGGPAPFTYSQAPVSGTNVSAVVLLILSGLTLLGCCLVEIPAVILAIVALTKHKDDPAGSRRLTRFGWIAFAAGLVLAVIVVVILFANGFSTGNSSSVGYS